MFFGLALIFIGVVLLLERLDVIPVGLDKLWPVLLIIAGVAILADRRRRHPHS